MDTNNKHQIGSSTTSKKDRNGQPKQEWNQQSMGIADNPVFLSDTFTNIDSSTAPFYVDAYLRFQSSSKQERLEPQSEELRKFPVDDRVELQQQEIESQQQQQDQDDFDRMMEEGLQNQLGQLEMIGQRHQSQLDDFEMPQQWGQMAEEHYIFEYLREIELIEQKENHEP